MKFQWVTLNNRAEKYGATKKNIGKFADEMITFNETIDGLENGDPGRPIVNGVVAPRECIAEGRPVGEFEQEIGVWVLRESMEGAEAYAAI